MATVALSRAVSPQLHAAFWRTERRCVTEWFVARVLLAVRDPSDPVNILEGYADRGGGRAGLAVAALWIVRARRHLRRASTSVPALRQ